jgi:hypothetical protein
MIQGPTGALVAALIATAALAGAQTPLLKRPDFTGTWRVTNIEMLVPPAGGFAGGGDRGFGGVGGGGGRGRGGRRGGGNGGGGATGDNGGRGDRPQRLEEGQTVRIRQTDDRLIVTEQQADGAMMSNYPLDGKETTNNAGNAVTRSKTKWEGVAIVTDSTRTTDTGRGKLEMKSREIRSLSDDGRTMTVRNELDTPRGKQTMTVTYSKVED